ncbi:FtsW/RodA/SpoVE family cell cycle protein [uncultured Mesonia sp.]|uniref:FtsW/RodA/SpoVE family cell cycle protein n=1 Tax=uncultured Mesonia sp. TaxID=399731 RepID=UPI00374FBCB4
MSAKKNNIKQFHFFHLLKGDKLIWAVVVLLGLFSFIPVYSASSNLAYIYGNGNTLSFLLNHLAHLLIGFFLIFAVSKIPYNYFKGLCVLALPLVIILLVYTLFQGTTIDGANASRWIKIPLINKTFQTSTAAAVILMVFVARYLSKIADKEITFKSSMIHLWLPVGAVLVLILPANFSTTAILFAMVLMLVVVGGYPLKYVGIILLAGIIVLSVFMLSAKAFPGLFPNRVDTWISRVENFASADDKEIYQVEKAKIAIARGGVFGVGVGKSVQRNFLPQSSSDFIYAIIVEEMGLVGGFLVLFAYLLILFRLVVVAIKAPSIFGKLLIIGVGLPIVFQALINMGVATELFPVTGQTLPLVSSGGSSIWMTCVALGMVQSVCAKRESLRNKTDIQNQQDDVKSGYNQEENPLEILSETL